MTMLLCKGKGCNWKKVCSRYVIGRGMMKYTNENDKWIDHCLHASKFVRMHGADINQCPENIKEQ